MTNGEGWEYCGGMNINGKYGGKEDIGVKFTWLGTFNHHYMSLKTMTLMFRPSD